MEYLPEYFGPNITEDVLRARSGASLLDQSNPKVKQLLSDIDYKEKKLQEAATLAVPSHGIQELMDRFNPRRIAPTFGNMISRLENETDYFEDIKIVGLNKLLTRNLGTFNLKPGIINVRPGTSLFNLLRRVRLFDEYDQTRATTGAGIATFIVGQQPSSVETWVSLATEGRLPEYYSVLYHELIHQLQIRSNLLRFGGQDIAFFGGAGLVSVLFGPEWLIPYFIGTTALKRQVFKSHVYEGLLKEAQSYAATENTAPFCTYLNPSHRRDDTSCAIGSGSNELFELDFDDHETAYDLLQSLRVMGCDERELAVEIGISRFDKKKGTFPNLVRLIEDKAKMWGVYDKDLIPKLEALLTVRFELNLRIQQLQARRVATEELLRTAAN